MYYTVRVFKVSNHSALDLKGQCSEYDYEEEEEENSFLGLLAISGCLKLSSNDWTPGSQILAQIGNVQCQSSWYVELSRSCKSWF